MSWTERQDDVVRAHWGKGLTAAEIGERIGKNKNQVLGRAHRLGLGPIKSTWTKARIAVLRERWEAGDTARHIGSLIGMNASQVMGKASRLNLTKRTVGRRRAPVRRLHADGYGRADGCQWLDGEPRQRQFCGAPTMDGSSYCETHHARCWIKHEDYKSEAA